MRTRRCLICPTGTWGGVGTQLLQGCQDIFGPNPSVLLDKAVRIYTALALNKSLGTIKRLIFFDVRQLLFP